MKLQDKLKKLAKVVQWQLFHSERHNDIQSLALAYKKLWDTGMPELEARLRCGFDPLDKFVELLDSIEQHIDQAGACLNDLDRPASATLDAQLRASKTACEQLRQLLT